MNQQKLAKNLKEDLQNDKKPWRATNSAVRRILLKGKYNKQNRKRTERMMRLRLLNKLKMDRYKRQVAFGIFPADP